MNPFGLLLGALAGLFVGNRLVRQNMDPAEYTATRIRYRTKFSKWVYGVLGVGSAWVGIAGLMTGGSWGTWFLLIGAVCFVWGWRVAPGRIVRQESARHAREQQVSAVEAPRLERGEFRPDDPEYWRYR